MIYEDNDDDNDDDDDNKAKVDIPSTSVLLRTDKSFVSSTKYHRWILLRILFFTQQQATQFLHG